MYEAEKAAAINALASRLAQGDISIEEYDKAFNTTIRNFERLAALTSVENNATNVTH